MNKNKKHPTGKQRVLVYNGVMIYRYKGKLKVEWEGKESYLSEVSTMVSNKIKSLANKHNI